MLWLIRHGETAWTISGAHTGWTDLPLTPNGEQQACDIAARIGDRQFSAVVVSPLQRARRTCELAGLGAEAVIDPDLREWNYGSYEGMTTDEIRRERPGWVLFRDGVPEGESLEDVAERAHRVIGRVLETEGDVALFAHGHLLRILATCWLGLQPEDARMLALGPASISALSYERGNRVIARWNS